MGRTVTVESTQAPFQQRVTAGPHHLLGDEPVADGGGDSGPNPYDLLLAALGTCTSMTVELYARRKGWPLERVEVALTHERVHAADCADCESVPKDLQRITRRLTLVGALDDAQRARLLDIANKCPVHRTLSGPLEIRTELAAPTPRP